MVYTIPNTYLFIYCLVSITSRIWFVLGGWKSIIVDSIPIFQNGIYILSVCCMHSSLMSIILNYHLPIALLIINIFEHMCLNNFFFHSNPPSNILQLTILKVIIIHENKDLLLSGDSFDLSPGNNDTTEGITLVLVGITFRNQLVWVWVVKEYWTGGTNTSSIFRGAFEAFNITNFFSVKTDLAASKIIFLDT